MCIATMIKVTRIELYNLTYGYVNIQGWDKDVSTQHEMTIPIIYRVFQKFKGDYKQIAIKCLKMHA